MAFHLDGHKIQSISALGKNSLHSTASFGNLVFGVPSSRLNHPSWVSFPLFPYMKKEIFILKGEKQVGPFSQDEILESTKKGHISLSDLYWCQGMDEWKSLAHLDTQKPLKTQYIYVLAEIFIPVLSLWKRIQIVFGKRPQDFISDFKFHHRFLLAESSNEAITKGRDSIPKSMRLVSSTWNDSAFCPNDQNWKPPGIKQK